MEMSALQGKAPYYFVPAPSKWPVLAGTSMLTTMIGAAAWVNGAPWGPFVNILGIFSLIVVLYNWFGQAISESEGGLYNNRIDTSFRWSMSWFIWSGGMGGAAGGGAGGGARAGAGPGGAGGGSEIL